MKVIGTTYLQLVPYLGTGTRELLVTYTAVEYYFQVKNLVHAVKYSRHKHAVVTNAYVGSFDSSEGAKGHLHVHVHVGPAVRC